MQLYISIFPFTYNISFILFIHNDMVMSFVQCEVIINA